MKPYKTAALTAVWRKMAKVDDSSIHQLNAKDKITGYILGILDKNSVETIKQRTIIIDSLIKKLKPKFIVEIGCGYSSRARRFQNIKFYELDLPYFKSKKNNVTVFDIEKDELSLDVKNALFIVEGVTMYLHEDYVIKLLKQIRKYKGFILIDFFNQKYSAKNKNLREIIFKLIFKFFIKRNHLFDYRVKNSAHAKTLLRKLGYKKIRNYKYKIPKTLDDLFYAEF